jgi:hypothetical protein
MYFFRNPVRSDFSDSLYLSYSTGPTRASDTTGTTGTCARQRMVAKRSNPDTTP